MAPPRSTVIAASKAAWMDACTSGVPKALAMTHLSAIPYMQRRES